MKATALPTAVLLGVLTLGLSAEADDFENLQPRLTVPQAWTLNRIVIDGDLRDRAWEQGTMTYGFLSAEEKHSVRDYTRARVIYDYHALYIGFSTVDANDAPLKDMNPELKDGQPVGDSLGLALRYPGPDGEEHSVHLWVDHSNNLLASRSDDGAPLEGIVSKVNQRDGVWDVEIAIPWAALGTVMPRFGDIWQADFVRQRTAPRRDDPERSTWVPGDGMGELRFGRDLLVYLYSKRPFHSSDEIMVYNYSDKLRRLSGEYYNEEGELVQTATVHLGPGHRRQHYRMEGFPKGAYRLVVRDRDVMDGADPVMMVIDRPQY